jgi:hypothetical protein
MVSGWQGQMNPAWRGVKRGMSSSPIFAHLRLPILEQLLELLRAQTRVPGDDTPGKSIDGVMPGKGKTNDAVRHDDVFTLPDHPEADFFESPY